MEHKHLVNDFDFQASAKNMASSSSTVSS